MCRDQEWSVDRSGGLGQLFTRVTWKSESGSIGGLRTYVPTNYELSFFISTIPYILTLDSDIEARSTDRDLESSDPS